MKSTSATILALPALIMAQTFTDCDPTKKTCPSDVGLSSSTYTVDFTQGESKDWAMTYGDAKYDAANGISYTITKSGEAPTMQSNFYIFFGSVSAIAKASPGTGIVSSVILESDVLDEIDYEWLGGDTTQAQSNYFGKGNTTTYDRGAYHTVATPQDTFHNYTIEWTSEKTTWYIDSVPMRTLNFADAVGGKNYPQTPMKVKMGSWIASDTGNEGTIQWAGGVTNFEQGPFVMSIKSISITNLNPGSTYTYGDLSGSYTSIQIDAPGATTANVTNAGSNIGNSSSTANTTDVPASGSTSPNATASSSVLPKPSATGSSGSASPSGSSSSGGGSPSPSSAPSAIPSVPISAAILSQSTPFIGQLMAIAIGLVAFFL